MDIKKSLLNPKNAWSFFISLMILPFYLAYSLFWWIWKNEEINIFLKIGIMIIPSLILVFLVILVSVDFDELAKKSEQAKNDSWHQEREESIKRFEEGADERAKNQKLEYKAEEGESKTSSSSVVLKNFTKEDVARFAISTIMAQPSNNISVKLDNGIYYLSYVRLSDSQTFSYKIKIEGSNVVWGNVDGRWRDSSDDEKITFEEDSVGLKITQTFSDGSANTKQFKKGE